MVPATQNDYRKVVYFHLYIFAAEGFAEACGGHNPKDIAREIQELGFLHTNEKDRCVYKCMVMVNGENKRLRIYAVCDAILEFVPAEEATHHQNSLGQMGQAGQRNNYNDLSGPKSVPVIH